MKHPDEPAPDFSEYAAARRVVLHIAHELAAEGRTLSLGTSEMFARIVERSCDFFFPDAARQEDHLPRKIHIDLARVTELAAQLGVMATVADALQIKRLTFYDRLKSDPQVRAAWERGMERRVNIARGDSQPVAAATIVPAFEPTEDDKAILGCIREQEGYGASWSHIKSLTKLDDGHIGVSIKRLTAAGLVRAQHIGAGMLKKFFAEPEKQKPAPPPPAPSIAHDGADYRVVEQAQVVHPSAAQAAARKLFEVSRLEVEGSLPGGRFRLKVTGVELTITTEGDK
ncbi:MAG: hypothetical protein ACJ741_06550 [Pyrinomonadaceae bacterium]